MAAFWSRPARQRLGQVLADRLFRPLHLTATTFDAAITEFGVDLSRLHWDLTSISLYGAYPQADLEYPAPRWGHPKDRRPDLKQIQAGLAVSGDGGIPVFHHAYAAGPRRWPRSWGR